MIGMTNRYTQPVRLGSSRIEQLRIVSNASTAIGINCLRRLNQDHVTHFKRTANWRYSLRNEMSLTSRCKSTVDMNSWALALSQIAFSFSDGFHSTPDHFVLLSHVLRLLVQQSMLLLQCTIRDFAGIATLLWLPLWEETAQSNLPDDDTVRHLDCMAKVRNTYIQVVFSVGYSMN